MVVVQKGHLAIAGLTWAEMDNIRLGHKVTIDLKTKGGDISLSLFTAETDEKCHDLLKGIKGLPSIEQLKENRDN